MQAVTYHGAHDMRVERIPDPVLEADDDVILRVTATAIGGADLPLYRGRMPGLAPGDVPGHEFMGIVEDRGAAVTALQRGDRVVVPSTVACGHCHFCERQLFAACETTARAGGAALDGRRVRPGAQRFGSPRLPGGQAEFVRVPKANFGPLNVPEGMPDEHALLLSDVLPTGYQAALAAQVTAGSAVAIFGAGPVGLTAAACARLLGAERLFVVDHHPDRLAFAQARYGAVALNFDDLDDPAGHIVEHTGFRGVDASIDAVGFDAKGSSRASLTTTLKPEGTRGQALRWAIAATRRGGVISVPGLHAGVLHGFPLGEAFGKGLALQTGPTHVQRFMPTLLAHILAGELAPQAILTHRLALSQAALGYQLFDKKKEDCRKVVLLPADDTAAPREGMWAGQKEAPG